MEKKTAPTESNQDDFFAWCFYCHNFCCLPFFPLNLFFSSLFLCLSHFSFCAFLHVVTTLFFLSLVPCYYTISFVISHNLPRCNADYSLITTESKRSYKPMISTHPPAHYYLMKNKFSSDAYKIVLIKYDIQIPQNLTLNFISTVSMYPLL